MLCVWTQIDETFSVTPDAQPWEQWWMHEATKHPPKSSEDGGQGNEASCGRAWAWYASMSWSSIQRIGWLLLGLTGVGTLKNLVEEGFDAVGFERNEYVGGLWKWSPDETQTTAVKCKDSRYCSSPYATLTISSHQGQYLSPEKLLPGFWNSQWFG